MSADRLVSGFEFLAATPLLWLSLTLGAYVAATVVGERCYRMPLLNPTLLAIALVVVVLTTTGTSYKRYFDGAQFVDFLLGPTIVAMAVPLYRHTEIIRKSAGALFGALVIGSVTAILSGVLVARGLGGDRELWLSMAPNRPGEAAGTGGKAPAPAPGTRACSAPSGSGRAISHRPVQSYGRVGGGSLPSPRCGARRWRRCERRDAGDRQRL